MHQIKTSTELPRSTQVFAFAKSLTGDPGVGQADVRQNRLAAERALDEVLAESFPASDPPSWTPGVVRPQLVARVPYDTRREANVVRGPQSASAATGGITISRSVEGERTFIDAVISLAAACGIVLIVPFAILLVGVPIALLVRGLVEAFNRLVAFIIP